MSTTSDTNQKEVAISSVQNSGAIGSAQDSEAPKDQSTWEQWLDRIVGLQLFAFAMFIFGVNILRSLQSSDTGWLAKTGEYILLNQRLPVDDIFSWTMPDRGWTVYQWLYMLLAGTMLHCGGLWLVGLSAAVMSAIVFVWLLPSQMLKHNVRLPYIFGLLALVVSPAWFWARPQLISFLLIPVLFALLERFRTTGYTRALWSLPLLMVIWVNGHSFWFIGLLIIASYLIPGIVKASGTAQRKKLSLLLAASFGAVLLNPYGVDIITYNCSFLTEPDFSSIDELQPQLITHWKENQQTVLYFVGAWALLIFQRKHVPKNGFLLALCGTIAAFRFFRFVPVGILLTWPFVAIALGKITLTAKEPDALSRIFRSPALPAFAVALSVLAFCYWYPVNKPTWFIHSGSNQDAVSVIKKHPELRPGMLTDAAVGCSLIVEGLAPVFIDTRFDFYGKQFCDEWLDCLRVRTDWRPYMKKWNIKSVCLANKYKLYEELKKAPDWLCVFDDDLNSIWVPDTVDGRKVYEMARLTPGCDELRALKPKVQERVAKNLSHKSMINGKAFLAIGDKTRALDEFRRAKLWTPSSAIASRYVEQLTAARQRLQ